MPRHCEESRPQSRTTKQSKQMKKLFVYSAIFVVFLALAAPVFAQIQINNPLSSTSFGQLLTNIAKGVAVLVGGISVIMIIWAGILYLTSAGSTEKIASAKRALTYAIVGIVIALLAEGIVATIKQILSVK